jgi:8-oxo-dGTP pyrophosphatase MutT (NUDIX family)
LLAPADTRLQAAVIHGNEILVLELHIDDDHRFLLLPGGGREANDIDEAAAVAREVLEETGCRVMVERLLRDAPSTPRDKAYRRYRTFLCRLVDGTGAVPRTRDGVATILRPRWLRLDDSESWSAQMADDTLHSSQLRSLFL